MYKIIGVDQKEYGPITGEQIRYWINEGRVNANTQARLEGATAWQPLSAFAEFSEALGLPAPTGAAPGIAPLSQNFGGRPAALEAVKAPAIGLIAMAGLYALASIWGIIQSLFSHPDLSRFQQFNMDPQIQKLIHLISGPLGAFAGVLSLIFAILILFGAIRMLNLRNYQLAFTVAILAMLPCSVCCVLGLPFGIWALVVLNKPEIKSQFTL